MSDRCPTCRSDKPSIVGAVWGSVSARLPVACPDPWHGDERPMLAPTPEQKAAYLRQQEGPTVALDAETPDEVERDTLALGIEKGEWDRLQAENTELQVARINAEALSNRLRRERDAAKLLLDEWAQRVAELRRELENVQGMANLAHAEVARLQAENTELRRERDE